MSNKGYFRLVGRVGDDPDNFEEVDITAKQLPFTLGDAIALSLCLPVIAYSLHAGRRESSIDHLCLGIENSAISREHARIFWDDKESSFMLEVMGKNKCAVDKQIRSKGDKIKLASKSTMRFSNARLYFLLPEPDVPAAPATQREFSPGESLGDGKQKGYLEYVNMAFEAVGRDGKPLSTKNIIDWVNDNCVEIKEQKRVNLYQGVYTALKRKYEKVEEVYGDRNGYLWRKRLQIDGAENNDDAGMSDDGILEERPGEQ